MIKTIKAEEIPEDRETEQKQDKKRRDSKRYIILGVLGVVGLFFWYMSQPIKGPIHIGICRTFAELHIQYPYTLRVHEVEQFERSWRLYYTYIGPFGENSANMIECRFTTDPRQGLILENVILNRVNMPPETIQSFNRTIPIIAAYDPQRFMPFYGGDSLADLWRGT